VDELAVAGGFRGKPIEVVKCETNDLMVPAHAEFIIEGEIPSMDVEEEGPYGEMFGYLGQPVNTFYVNVKAITHRKKPWLFNIYTGAGSGYFTLPWDAGNFIRMKEIVPSLKALYTPPASATIGIISIEKKFAGEGFEAGMAALGTRVFGFGKKIIIVVDDDVDVADINRVMHAVGSRWQPVPATQLIDHAIHMPLDPSLRNFMVGSKVIIDATRQTPLEGGPEEFPEDLRTSLLDYAPESFELVDQKWDSYFKK
jgi:UbiD family decarboxylase